MKKQKTKLDLHLSASAAALATLDVVTPFDLEREAMARFISDGHLANDWPYWKDSFNERRNYFRTVSGIPATETGTVETKAKAAQQPGN